MSITEEDIIRAEHILRILKREIYLAKSYSVTISLGTAQDLVTILNKILQSWNLS